VSLIHTSDSSLSRAIIWKEGYLTVSQLFILALLITLAAIAADQCIAPGLYSSSPLWATATCVTLVWRRGNPIFERDALAAESGFSFLRIALFAGAHALLVYGVRFLPGTFEAAIGTQSFAGWITSFLKLSVLLPTLFLLPLKQWKILVRLDAAEGIAAAVVLFTFFPGRILTGIWPWYGQILGKLVFYFSAFFVPGLIYSPAFAPTIHGPSLDVTILYACSGISGIELFDYLFVFVVLLDWNRLRKGRTLIAYFGGVVAMFIGNALRISSFVIFGNREFAGSVANYHLSAGWIFFSLVFLTYLSLTYRKLLLGSKQIRPSS